MSYSREIKASNIVITHEQQEQIFDIWKHYFNQKSSFKLPSSLSNLHYQNSKLPDSLSEMYYQNCFVNKSYDFSSFFNSLGIEYKENKNNIKITYFQGTEGEFKFLFELAAKIISEGSYISWKGEDGDRWSWYFDGNVLIDCNKKECMEYVRAFKEKKEFNKKLLSDLVPKIHTNQSIKPHKL